MKTFFIITLLGFVSCSQPQTLKIGIIADCQYCNCDFNEDWNNDYRKGAPRLQLAVDDFNTANVEMVFHLGDFIDRDFESYSTVKPIINSLTMPTHFVLGNHEFSVADSLKGDVLKTLGLEASYYTVKKMDWLFIVLDGTDISPYRSSDSNQIAFANAQMEAYNKMGRSQAKPWNGALGTKQMAWLEGQLKVADQSNLKVIVLAHFPVLPKAALNLWNDVEVVDLLNQHKSVKAYFNGHHHPGNYALSNDIHYVTFQGMVRSTEETAFAVVELSGSTINIYGKGREPNRTLSIK